MELTPSQKKAAAAFGICAGIASIVAIAVTVSVSKSSSDEDSQSRNTCQGCEVTASSQPSGSAAFVAITWTVVVIFFILLFVAIAKPNMF